MGVQVPREKAICQRKRPSEAAIEGFALANTGEVHRVPSLVPRGQRLVSPVGELKSITMEERPNRHKTPTAHHPPPAGPPIVPTIARN